MKRRVIFLVFIIISQASFAQLLTSRIEKEGDLFFENNQYLRAIYYYKKALEETPNLVRAQYKLGNSYRLIRDYESAEYYYQSIAESKSPVFPLAGFYYALMQKQKGKYAEALRTFKTFSDFLVSSNNRP